VTSQLKVTQVRSPIGKKRNQRDTLQALGLRRVGDMAAHSDDPVIRGMISTVGHLITVEEV
jgi:large subunit ribosomal protein L30